MKHFFEELSEQQGLCFFILQFMLDKRVEH